MPKQRHRRVMEGLVMPTKIRKRGCSSSSSSSSRIHYYRLNKRAIVVGRNRAGLGGSRSDTPTPVPTWRTAPLRSAVESPKHSQSGRSAAQPVSARRLAATLWEMNEIPSPRLSETDSEAVKQQLRKSGNKAVFQRERMQSGWGLLSTSGSGSLPPTVSEVDRSGICSERTPSSISQRLTSAEQNAALFDSISNASFMEVETRSRPPTPSGLVSGARNRLKDVRNALTTSKELVKIINRIWVETVQPSSSMSVISALHAELERGRMQVNYLMQQEQRTGRDEVHHLLKRFAEEKMMWKNKEHEALEAAIASIAGELEVERKLRRRLESLNKKLGKDLTEIKSSFMKAVKELESEKRAREVSEQVCEELTRNVDEDRAQVEKLKSESIKIHQEAEKEREMLELADKLREGRVQMKLSEAKHQFEEKSSAISKLRKQLELFLGAKRDKDEERATSSSKSNIISHQQDEREVEDAIDSKAESLESDNLIELTMNNTNKIHKWASCSPAVAHDSKRLPVDEIKARNSISGQISRRSTALQRVLSEGVEWGARRASHYEKGDGLDRQRFPELEKEAQRRSYFDEIQRYKPVKGLLDHVLSSPRSSLTRDCYSPSQQREQPLISRTPKW